jgi:hypothetical protein
MYRQASYPSRARNLLPSPAPDELSESESDLIAALEEKRREIHEDIETFKSRKEEELRRFEDELRSQKRRNTSNDDSPHSISPKLGLSSLNKKDLHANDSLAKDKMKAKNVNLSNLKSTLGPSKPSLSIDKVTINGTTTPPVCGTPPLGRNLSRSPTKLSATPPRSSFGEESNKPSTPSEKENNFEGLFTPGYLQLLETQHPSLPQSSTSPSAAQSERALASPMISSNSLPSALKTASDIIRKRKHVTFRLAHSVVVDPSSSYEETLSPSSDQSEKTLDIDEAGLGIEIPASPLPVRGPTYESEEGLTSPAKDVNEASFFSFDEELQDNGEKPPIYQKVTHSGKRFRHFGS